jgi:hypothetical protein
VKRIPLFLLGAIAAVATAVAAWAQAPSDTGRRAAAHAAVDLECAACHKSSHVAVLGIYAGSAGRGVPASPARMFELRVQCLACHTAPANVDAASAALGHTYRANDAACATCHGARYDGLIDRWRTSFASMREALSIKLRTARAALGEAAAHPAHGRAQALVADADFNTRLVALGNGAHNPFYAANLLRRASAWLDEAMVTMAKPAPKAADAQLAGGYCATLCHEPAGMKTPSTASFGGKPFPHTRHVAELGATCTTCHSPDAHKKLAATPATCSSCHHRPGNERCESCHRDQTAFYRGTVRTPLAHVTPNVMAETVACTGCHDFSHGPSRGSLAAACTGCHERTYLPLLTEWTTGVSRELAQTADALRAAEAAVNRARAPARNVAAARALLVEARTALAVVRAGGGAHNPPAADDLIRLVRDRVERARAELGAGKSS